MKTTKMIYFGCLIAVTLAVSGIANAQDPAAQGDPALNSFRLSLAGSSEPGIGTTSSLSTGLKERGVTASDIIKGNGTKAGYMLGHGGIVDASETISVGGSIKRRNKDYYLDYSSGSILFADPVHPSDVVKANYQYVPGKEGQRSGIGVPSLSVRLGGRSTLGLLFSSNAAVNSQGYDIMTYGLNLKTSLGKNSSMTNMMYMSSAQDSGRVSLLSGPEQKGAKPKADNMIIHDSLLQSGNITVKLNYQDVGKDFSGFAALRQQNAAPEAILSQLEKEKDIKRMGMQADIKMGGKTTTGLGFNRISDASGDILRQSFKIGNDKLKFNTDLQKIDAGFARLGDLSDAERTAMALSIYQQFDQNATAANVTDQDRAQILGEAGVNRRTTRLSMGMGKESSMQLSMLSIGDKSGGISRQTLSLTGKKYSITGFTQEIAKGFTRLGALANVEKANFANESGLKRTNLIGNFTLDPTLHLSTSMSKISSDAGGLLKYGINLISSKLTIAANYMNMDPGFTRVMDLADADKGQMAGEQGMRRYDLTTHLQATKAITIDSYLYDAKNSQTELFKRQLLNSLVFSPAKGPKVTMLLDRLSTGTADAVSGYSHQKYTLDHMIAKITFSGLRDTMTTENPTATETVDTTMLHFNTDLQKSMTINGDLKSIKISSGKFEDTQTLRLNTKLNARMAFIGMRSTIRTDQMDVSSQEYGVTGKVTSKMSIAAKFGDTLVNGLMVAKTRELSLNPDAPKDYGIFKQVAWQVGMGQVQNGGKIQTESNIFKVNTNVLNHKLDVQYVSGITQEGASSIVKSAYLASDPNPKRKINYSLAYKMRDTGAPRDLMIRTYDADWQITPFAKLIYNYKSNTEKPDGTVDPTGSERLKLATAITKTLGLLGQWEHLSNFQETVGSPSIDKSTLSLGISGKLSSKATVEAGYGFDQLLTIAGKAESRTYKVKFDHQLDSDHFLTLSGTFTDWQGAKPATVTTDDVQYQIDFKTVFD